MSKIGFLIALVLLLAMGSSSQPPSSGRDPRWQTRGAGTSASIPGSCTANRDVYICTNCATGAAIYYCIGGTYQAQGGSGTTVTIASGAKALATAEIASGACTDAQTDTATGTATTDTITFTPNADITAVTGYAPVTTGGLAIYPYPTTNQVNFRVCNPTSSAITPGAVTLNWRVVR